GVGNPGREALRVEQLRSAHWTMNKVQERFSFELKPGEITSGTRPVAAPTIPAVDRAWELRPRLFVDVTDAARLRGRPVLADFATLAGAIGMPCDARSALRVGAPPL